MAGFSGLGFLTQPMLPQDLLDPDLPQLEENLQQVIPPEKLPEVPWHQKAIQYPGTLDTGVSSWHPQGVPEYGLEGDPSTGEPPSSAYPSLKGKVIESPNEETGQPGTDVPARGNAPEPIALQRFTTNGGFGFTVDNLAWPKVGDFFDESEQNHQVNTNPDGAMNSR